MHTLSGLLIQVSASDPDTIFSYGFPFCSRKWLSFLGLLVEESVIEL